MNARVEEPGKDNVHNNAFYAEETLLKSELEAMRDCDPSSARHWIVRILAHIFLDACIGNLLCYLIFLNKLVLLRLHLLKEIPFQFLF